MSAGVIGLLTITAAALPIVLAIHPELRFRSALGTGALFGTGLVSTALLLLAMLRIPWSLWAIAALILPVSAAALLWQRRHAATKLPQGRSGLGAIALELLAYLPILGFARWAAATGPWQGDFWSIWGLKGRVFFESRGIDWQFLESADNLYSHPDYPPLFPLVLDYLSLVNGVWSESAVAALYATVAAAVLLIVRDAAARTLHSAVGAALLTVAISNLVVTRWIGQADGILLAFGTAGILITRQGLLSSDRRPALLGAILLGFSAMTKNEGIALVVAAFLAVAIVSPRRLRELWPAAALALLWPLLALPHALSVDLVQGDPWSRAMERLTALEVWRPVAPFLVPYEEKIWIGAAIAIGAAGWSLIKRERFLIATLLVQLLFCLVAYLATPNALKWHVATSWQRVSAQLTPLVAFLGLVAAAEGLRLFVRIARPDESRDQHRLQAPQD